MEKDGSKVVTTGFLELTRECTPMSDHIGLCDDDGMPFCLTSLLPLVGKGVKITIEFDEETDARGRNGDYGNEPLIYKAIGMTPTGYAESRAKMQEENRHAFSPDFFMRGLTGEPLSPECSTCNLLESHPIHK